MSISPNWPTYQTGPHDSIFALGVASTNFANFERTVTWMYAAVSWIPEDQARMIQARVGTTACIGLIAQVLAKRGWPPDVDDLVRHFLTAGKVLIESRNLLMHSVVIDGGEDTANFYRTSRKGEFTMVQASLSAIRDVADNLATYFNYGLALANCIAVKIWKADQAAGTLVFRKWPEKPPMPRPLIPN